MKYRHYLLVAAFATAALSCSALAQDKGLGKLTFPTSCDPKVRPSSSAASR